MALENPILYIQLGHPVLVHQAGQNSEGRAGLGHDGNGDRCTDPVLSLLHLQIVEKGGQHVVWPNSLGNVAKCVDCCSSDSFLVSFQQLQQLETNPHPLPCTHVLRTSVSNSAHQVNAILLNFLVTILQDRSQSWQEVLDGWSHLRHPYNIHYCFQSSQYRSQNLRILLPQILIQHNPQVAISFSSWQVFMTTAILEIRS